MSSGAAGQVVGEGRCLTSPAETIKEVVEERTDEKGRLVKVSNWIWNILMIILKVTRKIRLRLVSEKVCPEVAARSEWKKFGDATFDGPGPNISSTIIGEPVYLKLSLTKDHDREPAKVAVVEAKNIVCRYCKGAHWSARCPYKSTFAEEVNKEAAASAPPKEEVKLKYVPPSMRKNLENAAGGGTTMEGTTTGPSHRDNPNTIRISNLAEICTDADIRDLVSRIAPPVRVYVVKDQRTLLCRGSAFVSFHIIEDAQKAIQKLNGYPYGNLILNVEMAKPQLS